MKRFLLFVFVCYAGFSFAGVPGKNVSGLPLKTQAKADIISRLQGFGNMPQDIPANALLQLNPSDVRYNWDTVVLNDTVGPAEKYTRVLDNNGRELSELNYVMDAGNWVLFNRVIYTYDARGNQISFNNDHWVNGAWVFFTRDTMTYDASGNCLETVIQYWLSGAWQNSYKFYSSYDAGGNVLSEGDASWSNGAWVNETRNTYTLDAQGKALTSLYEVWQNDTWSAHGFETNTYDASGRLQITVGQIWQNGAWVNSGRMTFSYNAASQELLKQHETWDTVRKLWVNYRKYTSSYDVNYNLLAMLSESWDTAGNAWVNFSRWRYFCDANGNSTDGIDEVWKAGNCGPGMSSLNIYSQQELVYTFWWPLRYQYHATFKSYTSGLDEKSGGLAFLVYPNPAAEKITIESKNIRAGQKLTIYDMQGRPVMQSTLTNSTCELEISRLAAGNYLIRLGSGVEAGSAHFVKK